MIILHAGRTEKQFFVWGEGSAEKDILIRKRGRLSKKQVVMPYPYDTGIESLSLVLKGLSVDTALKEAKSITAWIPTRAGIPIPSSSMIADPPDSKAKLALAPWTVFAYLLEADELVDFLCTCMGKKLLAQGLVSGSDLLWWMEALKFAGSLVTEQKYLPSVKREDEKYVAIWEPVFIGEDAEKLAILSKQMPPVARALSCSLQTGTLAEAPKESAAFVALGFISWALDFIVRSAFERKKLTKKGGIPAQKRDRKSSFDSVHDAWVYALKSQNRFIPGNESELSQLAIQTHTWQRPLAILTNSPLRLCFRLEEPDDENEEIENERSESKGLENEKNENEETQSQRDLNKSPKKNEDLNADIWIPKGMWYLRYFLQPYEDPSLLVPVKDAWKPKKGSPLKKYNIKNIRQYLLSSLGQAACISTGVTCSLEAPNPAGYTMDNREAYEFLTEKATALSQAGFGVLLPSWWTHKGTKAHLRAQAKVGKQQLQTGNGLTLEKIIKFDWEVALGDRELTLAELQALAKLKAPLVKVRGQWVEVNETEIQAALEFWKKNPHGQASLRDVLRLALGASEEMKGFEFEGLKTTGWLEELIKQLTEKAEFEELQPPVNFSGTLRPYQVRGYSWLAFLRQWGFGACLADDMGLGKTIQTLALIQRDWEQAKSTSRKPVLLACPTSVINNWKKEAARFTPELPVMVHHGIHRKKEKEFLEEAKNYALVVSSYGLIQRDVRFLKEVAWAGIVLDEAQNVKNAETKQAKASRALPAEYRIALTGTPVENNVGDLWSIMEFLNPGFLGSHASFKKNFFIPIQAEQDKQVVQKLKAITGSFILRRLKTDPAIISDLPEKLEMKTYCTLTKEQASLYSAVVENVEKEIDEAEGIQRRGLILSTLMRLKQICNHPAQFLKDNSSIQGRSGKLSRLSEMLEIVLENGEKALVFTQFAEMGKILKEHLQERFGCEVLFLYGETSKKKRDQMIERFQNEKEYLPIFVLSLKAGGTGLNLTGANHVFHFDRWWNPAVENQATDRAFRIGQTKNVEVYKLICAGTLEERIDEILEKKVEIAENVVGTGEGWLTEFSNEELKDLFTLREEAIEE